MYYNLKIKEIEHSSFVITKKLKKLTFAKSLVSTGDH